MAGIHPRRTRATRVTLATCLALTLVATACGNSEGKAKSHDSKATPTSAGEKVANSSPGVTDTEIRVGGVASVTNPIAGRYGDSFTGVKAYFDMVNSEGGIYGRKLVLAQERDDKVANNKAEVEALIGDPGIFAVLPVATILFSGADALAASGIPTFGWTINPEWEGTKDDQRLNLFGQTGSFMCFGCSSPSVTWIANKLGKKKIAVLGYSVPQATKCADGYVKSFSDFGPPDGPEVVFQDSAINYGVTDLSVQVRKMKEAGVDMVVTCMDANGVVTLAKEQAQQELHAINFLVNGYDHDFVKEFGDIFEGSVVRTDFVTWETPVKEQPKGLKDFLEWMDKAGAEPTENAMVGWINAATFVNGLRNAGADFDRQKVVDAVNSTTDFTADGIIRPVKWPNQHYERASSTLCDVLSTIKDSKFVPDFGKPGKPFNCIDDSDPANLKQFNAAADG